MIRALGLLTLIGCGLRPWDPDPDDIGEGTIDPLAARALQDVIGASVVDHDLVGVQAAVIDETGFWTGRAGTSDWQRRRDLELDDQLRIASISKVFTATLVMQAVEEGLVSLDETIGLRAPGLSHRHEITVRQLLAHEAGTLDLLRIPSILMTSTTSPRTEWDPSTLLGKVAKREPAFPPGTDWGYSNTNYLLLALLLEELFDAPYDELLAERIATPLGLSSTVVPPPNAAPRLISGYDRDFVPLPGRTVVEPDHTSWGTSSFGSGAIVSTALDLATFGDALMAGDLVGVDALEAMLDFRPVEDEAMPHWTGVGLGLFRSEHQGTELWGHEGQFIGFSGSLAYDPERGATAVVLTNTSAADLSGVAGDLLAARR